MKNEENKNFIIEAHRLYMKYRPYDSNESLDVIRKKEDEFWTVYYTKFSDIIPKTLYKYRGPTEKAIENFKNDTAWFSHPIDFDDTMDLTLNNDIEEEIDEIEKNPSIIIEELSLGFIRAYALKCGVKIDTANINGMYQLFNEDGTLNEASAKKYLMKKMPNYATNDCISLLKQKLSDLNFDCLKDSLTKSLNYFMMTNDNIRKEALCLSLAEEGDNQAMWGLYAQESKGFCIEYEFPNKNFLAQRMMLNLFPIYYGKKVQIKFFDAIIKGIYSKNKVAGIDFDNYKEWLLSAYTKDISYSFQKEWRIVLDNKFGGNLQSFPFVKSIILGERIAKRTATRLINIAKEKQIEIYQRKFNKTNSKIIIEKIEYLHLTNDKAGIKEV